MTCLLIKFYIANRDWHGQVSRGFEFLNSERATRERARAYGFWDRYILTGNEVHVHLYRVNQGTADAYLEPPY